MKIKALSEGEVINVISAYAPQTGCREEDKEQFREELEEIRDIAGGEMFLGADFNGRVGRASDSYEEIHETNGFGQRNIE